MTTNYRDNRNKSALCDDARGGNPGWKLRRVGDQSKPTHVDCVEANDPGVGPEFHMLEGITAFENDQLQRRADAVERQLFSRRVTNHAEILACACWLLQQLGWISIKATWCGSVLAVNARIGVARKRELRRNRFLGSDDCLRSDLARAARKAGLKPGIEDIGIKVVGHQVLGTVGVVPVAVMDAALDRMLALWREQRQGRLQTYEGPAKAHLAGDFGAMPSRQPTRRSIKFD